MVKRYEIPLLKDHHSHPSIYAVLSNCINLDSIKDKGDALSLIKKSSDEITVILGWNSSYYRFSKDDLDSLPPVFICDVSFHNFLMNRSARDMLIDSHGEVVRNIDDSDWIERNLYVILRFIASIKKCTAKVLRDFFDGNLLDAGIYNAEEMLLPNRDVLEVFRETELIRRTRIWADNGLFDSLSDEEKDFVHGIKVLTDGAIGARTAAIKEPFLTGETGISVYTDDMLYNTLFDLSFLNKPVSIHAIGDLATDQIIKCIEKIKSSRGQVPKVRIEHSQFISKENALKAKSLGVVLSMQPNFNSDSIQYADRLCEDYLKLNNPFRMLIDEAGFIPGDDLILGSDGMPHGVQYALEQSLFPAYPSQRLSMEEFVAGYCMDNKDNGYIEVYVDEENRSVQTKVIVTSLS